MEKGQRNLRSVFLKYLFMSFIAVGLAATIPFLIYNIILNSSILLPANYVENQIETEKARLRSVSKIEEYMIPDGCFYAILDEDYIFKEGNLKNKYIDEAILCAKGELKLNGSKKSYKLIRRDNEYLVLQYFVQPRYSNEKLNDYLPNPDNMLIIIIVLNIMVLSIIIAVLFAKNLRKELEPLFNATKKIKEQKLDFNIEYSKIKEFNDVLNSIEDMKIGLKKSLQAQWNLEQLKNEQISMLSHDIKTPLTIIKGNAELLKENNKDKDVEDYIEYILEGTKDIETYIKNLLDITVTENKTDVKFEKIVVKEFVSGLLNKLKALGNYKNLKIIYKEKNLSDFIIGDMGLLQRGIMNVLSNAVEHTKENGEIQFIIEGTEKNIRFIIKDDGPGFTKEDIEYANKKFYMKEKSRNLKGHYGLGLYITNIIINLHNGKLILENRKDNKKGAKVVIEIPLNKNTYN